MRKYNIKSLEKGFVYEDEWFTTQVFLYAQKAVAVDNAVYYYRKRSKSLSSRKTISDEEFLIGLTCYERMFFMISKNISDKKSRVEALKRSLYNVQMYITNYADSESRQKNALQWYHKLYERYLI